MKKGYHSTQKKYFNTIPRTGFLGLALGYAVGLFLTGLLRMDGYALQIIGVVVGTAIGYWMDGKYYAEKDVPVEELDAQQEEAESAEAQQDEDDA